MDGDLKAAIEQYRKVTLSRDRAVAARALIRMGQCYEKRGDAEARKAYERVVREFGDQKESVEAAQRRLAGMRGGQTGQQATRAWTGPKADDVESSLSPDGRYILFSDWDTGNLGLHDLATGTDRLLTPIPAL